MVEDPNREIDVNRGTYPGIHSREIDRDFSVAEAMNKAVLVMDINSDIPAIAREMVSRNAGSIIITENGQAMGIITERGLVRGVITEDRRPSEVNARVVLSTPLITIGPERNVIEASEIMLKANIKRLPVLENRTVIGVISNTDILMITPGLNTILRDLIDLNREALLSIPSSREETPDLENSRINVCESCEDNSFDLRYVDGRYLCRNCRHEEEVETERGKSAGRGKYAGIHSREIDRDVSVAEAMNKAVIVIDINSDIPSIAREMVNHGAGSVIITENGLAMGIITEKDLVRVIISGDRKPSEVRAYEALSTPLITIGPERSIVEASEIMLEANIKRLPVQKDGTVIGVISNTDILMITPGIDTILRELIDMNREALLSIPSMEEISDLEDFITGICESCLVFSVDLRYVKGRYLCENCRQEEGENYE